jgi:hypothetical protein
MKRKTIWILALMLALIVPTWAAYTGDASVDRSSISNENCGSTAPVKVTATTTGKLGVLCWWNVDGGTWNKGTTECMSPGGTTTFTTQVSVPNPGAETYTLYVECHEFGTCNLLGQCTNQCVSTAIFTDGYAAKKNWQFTISTSAYSHISAWSSPDGALILLDGTNTGKTTSAGSWQSLNVSSGSHTVTYTKTNYKDTTKTVTVSCGGTVNADATLKGIGVVTVSTNPSGATVYLDGTYKGVSPLTLSNVEEGSYTVKVTMSGYKDYSQAITITAGSNIPVTATLTAFTIGVSSDPVGATVYVDGSNQGVTPLSSLKISEGSHTIKFTKSGYQDCEKSVSITQTSDTSTPVSCTLELSTGSIGVWSNPSGADVYLDGNFKNVTPEGSDWLLIQDVTVGSHTVKVSKSGYQDFTQSVSLSAGGTEYVQATLTQVQTATASPTVICTPNEKRCYGDYLQQCASDGSRWDTTEQCPYGCDSATKACRTAPGTSVATTSPSQVAQTTESVSTTQKQPGFEGILAIAGLLAFAFFLRRRKIS